MRILHTSDWHLGRTLHGTALHAYQEGFHDWLVELVAARGVDAVVIPGDVYDRAVPPVEAVRLLGRTLERLAEIATVIVTPGNHDSADRLGFGSRLLRGGVHILADAEADAIEHPVVVPDAHGEVLFFGLPYLEPDLARFSLAEEEAEPLGRSHEAVTRRAMEQVLARIETYRREGATELDDAPRADGAEGAGVGEGTDGGTGARARPRSVVLAHTFVAGGSGSDSERDLSVGGVDSVPASVLAGVDYVALGHLHGCQDLTAAVRGGAPGDAADGAGGASADRSVGVDSSRAEVATTAWYSGSPLAFSFSEKDQRKSVLLVDLGAPGEVSVERIATPVPRPLTELRGTLESILGRAREHGGDWVKAVVTDAARPPHLQQQLLAAYPHLLHTEYAPEGREAVDLAPAVRRGADPVEVMDDFIGFVTGADPTPAERDVLASAYDAARAHRREAS